ncbi:lipopolysaccharide biosynthesis protein [Pseudidiomarina sediminum]|uniref:lipopolysaccharide biosynthesis protein n=1 Tax=Pseudidiomarina sediminum TaxID=431675 RepID=UPI001C9380E6|nr:oligosaccharide flippase family protein [Pseudidiomarina sediminum]MBY6063712.1 oligosaccharide flippase family protein [Pseudidiomarina sediminum]
MSGTAAAQVITALSMPIVTRLYTPEMIGLISVYLAFFNFWLTLLTLRFESALLIAKDEDESHHIFRLGSILVVTLSLLSVPALYVLIHYSLLGFEVLPVWVIGIGVFSLLGYGWFMLYRSWLLRLSETKSISIAAVSRSAANVGVRLVTGVFSLGSVGLFLAEISGSWAALSTVRKKTKALLTLPNPQWSASRIFSIAKRYRKFPLFETPSVFINQLAIALPVPIVGMMYGSAAAGWFGLARLLYAIPNGQLGKAAGDVFQMELSSRVREERMDDALKLFYKFSSRLALIGLVPLLLAVFVAPAAVRFIFGDEWIEMGNIVATMAPWMYMALIVSSMSRALSVLEKQEFKLLYDITALFVVGAGYLIAKHFEYELIDFIGLLSIGMSIAYTLYFGVIALSIRNYTEHKTT